MNCLTYLVRGRYTRAMGFVVDVTLGGGEGHIANDAQHGIPLNSIIEESSKHTHFPAHRVKNKK